MLIKFEMMPLGVRMSVPGRDGQDLLTVVFDERELITALEYACTRFHTLSEPQEVHVKVL